ncbi:hypothetical protein CKO_04441 [Citrobacter koseri ATCC BAA-895]|uniref:Uncharacterized protein n=1 Tax=Citrobacter koseri (strain ATCC BAA-895 / CDC 4225-83 / SGSC4696) TaxID=290338 RepID=A8APT4_CITK8|nr:hypothetical protein CKO_04441 [Citrobacter koseri ATCC BAA-895]
MAMLRILSGLRRTGFVGRIRRYAAIRQCQRQMAMLRILSGLRRTGFVGRIRRYAAIRQCQTPDGDAAHLIRPTTHRFCRPDKALRRHPATLIGIS